MQEEVRKMRGRGIYSAAKKRSFIGNFLSFVVCCTAYSVCKKQGSHSASLLSSLYLGSDGFAAIHLITHNYG